MSKKRKANRPRKDSRPAQKQAPIFVPKQDNQVALSLDECLDLIVEEQAARKEQDEKLNNLKAVAKAHLKELGLDKYENERGRKAQWYESQRASYDKELLKELLGDDFGRCVSYNTVKSFKVS